MRRRALTAPAARRVRASTAVTRRARSGTIITGQPASRSTRSATLPSRKRRMALRPCEPTTSRSAPRSAARRTISKAAGPTPTSTDTCRGSRRRVAAKVMSFVSASATHWRCRSSTSAARRVHGPRRLDDVRDGVKQADMAVVADEAQGRPDDFAGRLAEIDGGDDVAEPFHGGLSCPGFVQAPCRRGDPCRRLEIREKSGPPRRAGAKTPGGCGILRVSPDTGAG